MRRRCRFSLPAASVIVKCWSSWRGGYWRWSETSTLGEAHEPDDCADSIIVWTLASIGFGVAIGANMGDVGRRDARPSPSPRRTHIGASTLAVLTCVEKAWSGATLKARCGGGGGGGRG